MAYFNNFNTIAYDINGDGVYDELTNLTNIVKLSDSLKNNATLYSYIVVQDGERPEQLSYRLYGSTSYYWTFLMINDGIKNIWNDWPKSTNQLLEYSEKKYAGLAMITGDSLYTTASATGNVATKFEVGEEVTNTAKTAVALIREVHRNNKYLVVDVITGEFNPNGETIIGMESEDSISCTSIVSAAHAPKYHLDASTGAVTHHRSSGTFAYTNLNYETLLNDKNKNIRAIKKEYIEEVAEAFSKEISS